MHRIKRMKTNNVKISSSGIETTGTITAGTTAIIGNKTNNVTISNLGIETTGSESPLNINTSNSGGGVNIGTNGGTVNIGTNGGTVNIGNGTALGTIKANTATFNNVTSTTYNAQSDYRIKDNIKTLDLNIHNIDKLKPVIYRHKSLNQLNIGFIAHELQEEYPFLVSGVKDGTEHQSINYIGLIGLLTKEIQNLKQDNLDMKQRLERLEQMINK